MAAPLPPDPGPVPLAEVLPLIWAKLSALEAAVRAPGADAGDPAWAAGGMTAVAAGEYLDAVADGAMSVVQACAFTGDSEARLYQLMAAGVLVWFKQGEHRRITRRSLVEYLARALAAHDPSDKRPTPRKRAADRGAGART